MLSTGLTNAQILTMDPDHPVAHDLGIWRGRSVGLDEAVTAGPARRVVDLQGATVLPGFIAVGGAFAPATGTPSRAVPPRASATPVLPDAHVMPNPGRLRERPTPSR